MLQNQLLFLDRHKTCRCKSSTQTTYRSTITPTLFGTAPNLSEVLSGSSRFLFGGEALHIGGTCLTDKHEQILVTLRIVPNNAYK